MTNEISDADLVAYGYAPGKYTSICLGCMEVIEQVDARCNVCRSCAIKHRERASETASLQRAAFEAWWLELAKRQDPSLRGQRLVEEAFVAGWNAAIDAVPSKGSPAKP